MTGWKLGRYQSYVSYVESGQKVVDVVEVMDWATPSGRPARAIKHVRKVAKR